MRISARRSTAGWNRGRAPRHFRNKREGFGPNDLSEARHGASAILGGYRPLGAIARRGCRSAPTREQDLQHGHDGVEGHRIAQGQQNKSRGDERNEQPDPGKRIY